MSERTKYTLEEKNKCVNLFLINKYSFTSISKITGVSISTLKRWIRSFKNNGVEGLKESHTWRRYSKELKQAAVIDYLEGKATLNGCCEKYNISDDRVLRQWISKYTNSSELKDTTGGRNKMRSTRKTTLEERIKIVKNTISKGDNYAWACEKYNISYNQIYNWVRKFKTNGVEGLKDNRGKRLKDRTSPTLSQEEKYTLEVSKLKKELAEKEMEIEILKKLYTLRKEVKK